ncbi:MAG: hypothetical protein NBKEAIPA_02059 [Nitrospirae bacterium]|nr:hypothetical protein [Nitrospirota bacterium]
MALERGDDHAEPTAKERAGAFVFVGKGADGAVQDVANALAYVRGVLVGTGRVADVQVVEPDAVALAVEAVGGGKALPGFVDGENGPRGIEHGDIGRQDVEDVGGSALSGRGLWGNGWTGVRHRSGYPSVPVLLCVWTSQRSRIACRSVGRIGLAR